MLASTTTKLRKEQYLNHHTFFSQHFFQSEDLTNNLFVFARNVGDKNLFFVGELEQLVARFGKVFFFVNNYYVHQQSFLLFPRIDEYKFIINFGHDTVG